eukprot:6683877-Heterocapsa_arctica.AAC.1
MVPNLSALFHPCCRIPCSSLRVLEVRCQSRFPRSLSNVCVDCGVQHPAANLRILSLAERTSP